MVRCNKDEIIIKLVLYKSITTDSLVTANKLIQTDNSDSIVLTAAHL